MPIHKRELGAASVCCQASFGCACRCPGPAFPTATPGPSPPATAIVLFDTGIHEPGSLAHLERALAMCGLGLQDIRLLVCTHAHSDHYGQAATIMRARRLRAVDAPQARAQRGSGPTIPTPRSRAAWRSHARAACPRSRCVATLRSAASTTSGIAAIVEPDRALVPGRHRRTPTSAPGPCMRHPATRPRTSVCSSPSDAC